MGSTTSSPGEHEGDMFPPGNETSHFASPIIRVLVDMKPFTKEFFVHESLICSRSKFFQKAVHGEWKESEERKVSLPEDEPSVFLTYLNILYAGETLEESAAPEWERIESKSSPLSDRYLHICKVYVLAGKLMDFSTRESILFRLTHLSKGYRSKRECPSLEAVQAIYSGTPSRDPMRRELFDTYTDCINEDILGKFYEDYSSAAKFPPEFLLDLARNLAHERPTNTQLKNLTKDRDADRDKIWDLTEQLDKLNTDHKEMQAKLESKTKAFNEIKAQYNDAKAEVEAKNEELRSKDRLIKERDGDIAEKDLKIKNKNQAIKKKDQAIQALKVEQTAYNKLIIDKLIATTATKK
ncbi:hypothetical protein G6514_008513 [Epicoccum nigrum]|nr:hypothetical protein G6514_008513 [Epicoccum nigrum]